VIDSRIDQERLPMKHILSAILLLQWGAYCMAQEANVPGLSQFAGQDLRKLEKFGMPAFRAMFRELTGDAEDPDPWGSPRPWRVERFPVGDVAWVLLEGYPGYDVPDVSSMRIHVFDAKWKRITKQEFPTGYRMRLTRITLAAENPLGKPLVVARVVSTGPFEIVNGAERPAFEAGEFQRQYYALSGGQFVMVRLEDHEGRIVPNHYRWSAPSKGPEVPKRSREEWIGTLNSDDPAAQLAALVWLTGTHLSSKAPRAANVNQESVAHSELFEAVRGAAETRKALHDLAESENPWVREYAVKALHGGKS
jgi:hypothetical protein